MAESGIAANDDDAEFHLDEHGRVWLIVRGDCWIVGRRDHVCAEMWRFLGEVEAGEAGKGCHGVNP
jgi:hypothetical protein